MGQRDGQRHQFRCFVAGKAEHHALIACAGGKASCHLTALAAFQRLVDAHGNVRRTAARCDVSTAQVSASNPHSRAVVADIADRIADDAGNIDIALAS